jgi:hypothetical protein
LNGVPVGWLPVVAPVADELGAPPELEVVGLELDLLDDPQAVRTKPATATTLATAAPRRP